MNKGELFGDIVWGGGEMLWEAEEREEPGDPDNGAETLRFGSGDENVRTI